jgi:hypothetical protein
MLVWWKRMLDCKIFWIVTLCISEWAYRFGRLQRLHFRTWKIKPSKKPAFHLLYTDFVHSLCFEYENEVDTYLRNIGLSLSCGLSHSGRQYFHRHRYENQTFKILVDTCWVWQYRLYMFHYLRQTSVAALWQDKLSCRHNNGVTRRQAPF